MGSIIGQPSEVPVGEARWFTPYQVAELIGKAASPGLPVLAITSLRSRVPVYARLAGRESAFTADEPLDSRIATALLTMRRTRGGADVSMRPQIMAHAPKCQRISD
jgi:hypothetical protein